MVKRIIWSHQAKTDRWEIFNYWIQETGNAFFSIRLRNEFNSIISLLINFPELGKKVQNYDVRYLIKREYKIFYKIHKRKNSTDIMILHIWDTRRNPDEITDYKDL